MNLLMIDLLFLFIRIDFDYGYWTSCPFLLDGVDAAKAYLCTVDLMPLPLLELSVGLILVTHNRLFLSVDPVSLFQSAILVR